MRHWLVAGLAPGTWTPRRVWLTAFLAFFILSAAWALASPLTSVPDEPWHMVKAAATVRGQLHGTPITVITHNGTVTNHVPMTGYRLPTAYSFLTNLHECYFNNAHVPASCARSLSALPGTALAGSTAGSNNPVYYLAVGWPSLLSHGPLGMYGMRMVSAALSAAMLASAMVTAFQWSRKRRYPMAAVLAAATPMVLFLNGSVNPNSLEATSAILLWTAVLSLLTDPQPELVPRLLARAGIATMALLCVRQLGPAWAVVIVVCAALAAQSGALRDVIRRPAVWLWTGAVGVVALGSIAWTAKFNVLGTGGATTHPSLTFAVAAKHTFGQSVVYLRQMVGYFGWLDVQPPFHLAELWFVPVLALMAAAALVGKRRDVAALALLAFSVIAIPVLAQGRQAASLGYIWQGRYLLAVAAGLPLLAAAILAKREARGDRLKRAVPRLPVAVTGVTLVLGLLMFYTTLRRYAAGSSGSLVLWGTAWTPPGTIVGVVVLYLVGAGLAALVVLKSWAPYPGAGVGGGDGVAEGAPTAGDAAASATVAMVAAQALHDRAAVVGEGANGSAGPASVVGEETSDEDRGAAAVASGTPL
ncbi:DUF2142 domain-containing protein [Catenulispora pinisilvae]|uniref:DUF2142 domain-containing protein n=1 Tax=Catenulispora pinisilvae TaxID=2705253 RepID=UPI0018920722|nr:DUF2142 domain-containing protein [Catenulispora pinisilvae]